MSINIRQHIALVVFLCGTLFPAHSALAQFSQQGPKLVGTDAVGAGSAGWSVALSADGNTAIIGGPDDAANADGARGAAWVWTRSGGVWSQQGPKLVGSDVRLLGISVSLSADGNTAIIGATIDDNGLTTNGAALVWTRSGDVWSQQGPPLIALDAVGQAQQGRSVSLSADGNTAIIGGPEDDNRAGAAWVWTRSGGVWSQQGGKLVGSGAAGPMYQGYSVSLSADGNTAVVGGYLDNDAAGAVWVWTRSAGVWTQQGAKLVGSGANGPAGQGWSVSLSADGNTVIVGGVFDHSGTGAAWVWTRSGGVWTQQGSKLVALPGNSNQGHSVSLSANGNTAIVGEPSDRGGAWVWRRSGGAWTQQVAKLVGSSGVEADPYGQGHSVSLSADGNTAIVGRPVPVAGAWVFIASSTVVTGVASAITATGATLNGTADPHGLATTGNFEYGLTTDLGGTTPAQSLGSGNGAMAIGGGNITGLACDTLYYFRAVATSTGGTAYGTEATFRTAACPPTVVTGVASAITQTAATLNGTAHPNGTATTAHFEYGVTVSYGSATPDVSVGAGSASVAIGGGGLSSLTCGTLYHFRAVATNTGGTTNGSDAVFTTMSCAPACTFSLSAPSASVPAAMTTGSVTLTASGPSCAWIAVSNNGFITVTSPGAGTGTTLVAWEVRGNPITSPRIGTITIAGLTFTITQAGALTGRRVPNDFNHDGLGDLGVFRPSAGRFLIAGQPDTDWGAAADMPVAGDFNGDGNPDIAVFRPSNGTWYINGGATVVFGMPGDIPVPGDYNGDGTTEIAVFRPSTGMFLIRNGAAVAWGLAGDLPVVGDYNGDGIDDIAVYRPATGTWYVRNVSIVVFGFAADIPVPADYNGDGVTDIAVFRPATGAWLVKDQYTQVWGAAGDVPVPLDRDGDGQAELGVFRRATGAWYFTNHVSDEDETLSFGALDDVPLGRAMPPVQTPWGDYDGDRKADLTVFRPSSGDWVSLRSLSGMTDYTLRTFGLSGDVPVGRDYDGDGKVDVAVFRPSTGRWFVLQSSTNFTSYVFQDWGLTGDIPVPGDYDGDGKADFAVFRPSLGRWVILLSSTGNTSYAMYDWGLTGDIPVPADYDGDGRTDIAVFRPSLGRWVIKSSIDGSYQIVDWGLAGDVIVPADYDSDGKADVAVFRPSTGTWYVRGLFNRSWGLTGDIPALKNP